MWFFTMDRTMINCLGENTEKCKNCNKQSNKELLGIKLNYDTTKKFSENLLVIDMKNTNINE